MKARMLTMFVLVVTLLLPASGAPVLAQGPQPFSSPTFEGVGTSAQQAQNVELVGQIGGVTYAVAISGTLAYIGVGPRLVILNVADPAHPAVVGQTGVLPGVAYGVAVAGGYAYVADGGSVLPGVAYGVAVAGGTPTSPMGAAACASST